MVARYGYSRIYASNVTKKDEIILALLKQAFVFSVHAEMEQFWDGMNTVGKLGDLIMSSSSLFEALLCENPTKLDLAAFRCLSSQFFSCGFQPEKLGGKISLLPRSLPSRSR